MQADRRCLANNRHQRKRIEGAGQQRVGRLAAAQEADTVVEGNQRQQEVQRLFAKGGVIALLIQMGAELCLVVGGQGHRQRFQRRAGLL